MANQYLYDLTDTWNNVATTFDAIKINVTDTNSAAGSKLLNLQVGASPKFTVQKDGAVALTGAVTGATSITGSGTFTADRLTVTKTTANAPAISSTGYSLTGSDSTSLVDLAGTWNTSGAPTAIKLNVTNTASGASSLLMDLQVGGSSLVSVTKDGQVRLPLGSSATPSLRFGTTEGMYIKDASFVFQPSNNGTGGIAISQSTIFLPPSFTIGWQPSAGNPTQAPDTVIVRDGAANTLAQRNAGNAQTFNIYNTYSSSTSYERLSIVCQSNDSVLIRTNKGSGGGSARALILGTDGTNALTLTTAQKAEFAATIKTAAPTGGTAAEWKLGTVASVTPTSPDRTIEVEIGGTTYYLHAKTTNN